MHIAVAAPGEAKWRQTDGAAVIDRSRGSGLVGDRQCDADVVDFAAGPVGHPGSLGADLEGRATIRARRHDGELDRGLGELLRQSIEPVRLRPMLLHDEATQLLELAREDVVPEAVGSEEDDVERFESDVEPSSGAGPIRLVECARRLERLSAMANGHG